MRRGVAYGVMAGAFWGSVFIAPRLLPDFSPLALSAGRYTTYGLVSLLVGLPLFRRLAGKLTRQDCLALFSLSLSGNIIYYILLAAAVQRVGIAPTSLIIGLLPITVTLVGRRDHGAVALHKLVWPLMLVLLGIVCINVDVFTAPPASGAASWSERLIGLACATGALVSWTVYAVQNTRYLKQHLRYSGNEWSILSGIVSGLQGLLLGLVAMTVPGAIHQAPMTPANWHMFAGVNLMLAISASLLGNALWNAASKRLPLTLSGQMIVFETLFALFYGFVYDARLPRLLEAAAIALLLSGVTWSVQLHAKDRPATGPLPDAEDLALH